MSTIDDPRAAPGPAATAATPVGGAGRPRLSRREDGVVCYAENGVPVPGLTEVTLGESLDVRVVARTGRPPEAVLITAAEVEVHAALAWVPNVARRLSSDGGDEFEVPWAIWQEHAATTVDFRLAECDGEGMERELAIQERDVRFARHALEVHIQRRARLVAVAAALGMTRRAISELLGLSAGRVQQLVEEAPALLRTEVHDLTRAMVSVLRSVGERELPRSEILLPAGYDDGLIDELIAFGLLEAAGTHVRLTDAGERAELHLRAKHRGDGGEGG
jgi:hypothetical protein